MAQNDAPANNDWSAVPPSAALPRNVWLLGWASFFNDVASEMVFPLLPQFLLVGLGASKAALGWIEGLAESTTSLVKLLAGSWSDHLPRRRPLIVAGYVVPGLLRPLLGLASSAWQVGLLRFGDRIGKGVRSSPRDALLADSTPPALRGRAFGLHQALDHAGAALGPLLAAAFLWWYPGALRELFLLAVIPGSMAALIIFWGLREVPRTRPPRAPFRWSWTPLTPTFRWYLAILVVFTLGCSSDAFLLVRAGELGVPLALLPLLWTALHLLKSAGNVVAGRWVDQVGPRPLIVAGWLWYAVVYLGFAWADSAEAAIGWFLAYAAYYALTEPAEKALVAQLAGPEQRGLAFGWFSAAVGLGAMPASVLCGWLYTQFGPLAAFGTGAGLALVAAGSLAALPLPPSPPTWRTASGGAA